MVKRLNSLKIADLLEVFGTEELQKKAVSEIRRLHAENQALNDALQNSIGCHREMSDLAIRQRARLDELELQKIEHAPLKDDEARRIYSEATYHASLAVFMTRMDAEHPDADDKGVSGWLQEAEDRVKSRIA